MSREAPERSQPEPSSRAAADRPSTARRAPLRVLLADDHDIIRQGFRLVLGTQPDLEVVGEASDGREALARARSLRPDVVLMDVTMPVMDGLEATRRLKAEMPDVCVLMITSHEEPEYLLEAIEAGAAGYVLKSAPATRLVGAVRRVTEGEYPLNQELAARLIQRLSGKVGDPGKREEAAGSGSRWQPLAAPLTERELEVLRLLARGLSNPEIARTLVIARPTVKTHVERIIRKLRVSDRTQAAVRAIDLGLVTNNPS